MTNDTNTTKPFNALVSDLKTAPVFNKMGPGLGLIKPGNWPGLVKWAADFGYSASLAEIKTFMEQRPAILEKISKVPEVADWSLPILHESIEQSIK